jgi:hypothetical protein
MLTKLTVSYCLHPLTSEGYLRALEMALQQLKATTLIHHSDPGSQYCNSRYIRISANLRKPVLLSA